MDLEKPKILVVDDAKTIRALIRHQLEDRFEVLEAENGDKAIELLKEHQFVLVTLDVEMPVKDGFEVLTWLRENRITVEYSEGSKVPIPVVMISSLTSIENHRKGYSLGASSFIIKPFGSDGVNKIVNRVLSIFETLSASSILFVDDNDKQLDLVRGFLDGTGAELTVFENGKKGFEYLTDNSCHYDMIILGESIPGISCTDFILQARALKINEDIPILVLANTGGEYSVADYYHAGASDYCAVPFQKDELLAKIRSGIEARSMQLELIKQKEGVQRISVARNILIGGFIHDLKTPLSVLTGIVDVVKEADYSEEMVKSLLPKMDKHLSNMSNLVADMTESIKVSKECKEGTYYTAFSMTTTIQSAIDSLEFLANKKKIGMRFKNSIETDQISGNERKLYRVMTNLLSNAVKFTPENGFIDVSMEVAHRFLQVIVKDTGIGISEEQKKTLFESFTSSSRKGTNEEPGTGLGLSIVKSIIMEHSGQIFVDSEVGVGTTFTIKIPLSIQE